MATLGSVCFTASEGSDEELYPSLQKSMIEMVLHSLFKDAAEAPGTEASTLVSSESLTSSRSRKKRA
jgi:hypothetical protein